MKLKKHELIDAVALDAGCTHIQARTVLASAASVVHDRISQGMDVFLFGLGKLSVTRRGPRRARDIRRGLEVMVPPRTVVLYRPSDSLQAAANADT